MNHGAIIPALRKAVAEVVRSIPKGKVLSYSQVALRAGRPGGARAVVRALHGLRDVPWWRVIRADGTLAVEVADRQRPLLRRDGVRVEGRRVRLRRSNTVSKPKKQGP